MEMKMYVFLELLKLKCFINCHCELNDKHNKKHSMH